MSGGLLAYDPRRTYNAAAVDYDDASADFWRFAAHDTVASLGLAPGDRVLDVACGPGAAALAAAADVGRGGAVLGVDVAEEMITLARRHAQEAGAEQARFALGSLDALGALDLGAGPVDAAMCVFGMFFATDVAYSVGTMAQAVRPGGQVAVTTLGPAFFAPLYDVFVAAATGENPRLDVDVPWRRTENPDVMANHLRAAGLVDVTVRHEVHHLPLPTPEDWWRIAMGTGIRRLAMDLAPESLARVRAHNLAWVREHRIDAVDLGVISAHGRTPGA